MFSLCSLLEGGDSNEEAGISVPESCREDIEMKWKRLILLIGLAMAIILAFGPVKTSSTSTDAWIWAELGTSKLRPAWVFA